MFLDNIILLAVEFIPIIKNEIVRKYASAISTFRHLKIPMHAGTLAQRC